MGKQRLKHPGKIRKILFYESAQPNDWTSEGMNLVFDTLTYRINSTEASKQLIEVIPNEDYTEYTLKVTEGIEFSDGTKLGRRMRKVFH